MSSPMLDHALPRSLVLALLCGAALAGCGKTLPVEGTGHGGASASVTTVAGTNQLGASGLATKNTTRLGGSSPMVDAAAVALATNPGLTPATRPQAVVLVDDRDWPAALAAAALASSPLRAPLLYTEGSSLPTLSAQALAALKPTGAALLGGAQVIAVGPASAPAGYRTRTVAGAAAQGEPSGAGTGSAEQAGGGSGGGGQAGASGSGPGGGGQAGASGSGPGGGGQAGASGSGATGGGPAGGGPANEEPAVLAARVEHLVQIIHGGPPHRVIVIGADGPPALAMPAAGLAAESGAPILPVYATGIPRATRRVLRHLHHPIIYAVGPPTAVSHAVLAKLARFGPVRRIYAGAGALGSTASSADGETPAANAIAVARYSDGPFGWAIEQPGHGLVFALASRPLDAPAAAPLSASGDYAPLLLLERPDQVPRVLAQYLSDIQPGYSDAPEYQPVRGVYNHGWLIGDGEAITVTVQAELDAMLEISPPAATGSAASSSAGTEAATPTVIPPTTTRSTSTPSTTAPSTTAPSATTAPATTTHPPAPPSNTP
jgi:hypothetical protein